MGRTYKVLITVSPFETITIISYPTHLTGSGGNPVVTRKGFATKNILSILEKHTKRISSLKEKGGISVRIVSHSFFWVITPFDVLVSLGQKSKQNHSNEITNS